MTVRFTPRARTDILQIYEFVAAVNPITAQSIEDSIMRTVDRLGNFPGIGAMTDFKDVRRMPIARYPYTIFYRIARADNSIEILRVVHGASVRNLSQIPK